MPRSTRDKLRASSKLFCLTSQFYTLQAFFASRSSCVTYFSNATLELVADGQAVAQRQQGGEEFS